MKLDKLLARNLMMVPFILLLRVPIAGFLNSLVILGDFANSIAQRIHPYLPGWKQRER